MHRNIARAYCYLQEEHSLVRTAFTAQQDTFIEEKARLNMDHVQYL
jgi:hypothetical protein